MKTADSKLNSSAPSFQQALIYSGALLKNTVNSQFNESKKNNSISERKKKDFCAFPGISEYTLIYYTFMRLWEVHGMSRCSGGITILPEWIIFTVNLAGARL